MRLPPPALRIIKIVNPSCTASTPLQCPLPHPIHHPTTRPPPPPRPVFCAFATWMDANSASLSAEERQQLLDDVIPLIRFPAMLGSNLTAYWQNCSFLKALDPEQELLIAAVSGWLGNCLATVWRACIAANNKVSG